MPLTRLFETPEAAATAATNLKQAGFRAAGITLFSGAGVSPATLRARGVNKVNAHGYAKRIEAGATLLVVDAPFGSAAEAAEILTQAGGSDAAPATFETMDSSAPSPFSDALGIPVLSKNPAPFSSFWSMPTKSKFPQGKTFGLPMLGGSAAPFSAALGMKVLSNSAAPLSSMLGLPVLSGAGRSNTSLMHNPAPLSSALGLPVLTKKQE